MVNKVNRIEKRKQEFYQLTSEAGITDWLSEWWDNRKQSRDSRALQNSIRRFCKEIFKDFRDIEDFLTSRDPNGIAQAASRTSKISIEFLDLFANDMDAYLKLFPDKPAPGPKTTEPEADDWPGIQSNIEDQQSKINSILEKIESEEVKNKIRNLSASLETKLVALHMMKGADEGKINKVREETVSPIKN